MVGWQVTAVTVNCDFVAEEVTIIVKNDWSVKCTGFEKYCQSREQQLQLLQRSLALKCTLGCKGLQCPKITEYIKKLQAEETKKAVDVGEKK